MRKRKLADYGAYLDEMSRTGLRYIPLIFSAYGRMHPDTMAILQSVAKRAARRRGFHDHHLLLRRALTGIGVQIWRRAAVMVKSCVPAGSKEAVRLVYGVDADADEDDDEIDVSLVTTRGLVVSDGPSFLVG